MQILMHILLIYTPTGYQVRLTFTPFDVDGVGEGPMAGSGAGNETDSLEPTVNQCGDVPDYYEAVGPHTLYFVLEDSLLPNCSHNLTFSVSIYNLLACELVSLPIKYIFYFPPDPCKDRERHIRCLVTRADNW